MPTDPPAPGYQSAADPKLALQVRKMHLEAGWIGRVIGGSKNAPNNIAFVVVTIPLAAGLLAAVFAPQDRVEFWKTIVPIVTLTVGYLLGKTAK